MYYFIFFPLLGGAIGWVTNYLAIKFLFRPRNPWRIGSFTIQGVIPRRRHELAVAVGEVVSRELLPQDQIAAALSTPDIRRNMAELAGETVARRVASFPVLRPFPRALRAAVAQQVAKAVNREVRSLLADEGPEMVNRVLSSVDIAQLVADELNAMDWDYLEAMVYAVAGKELKLIEVMGGVLGALIGLVQAAVVYFV
ncbi:MAG TPA: DUF445 family protein [Bacillota bacterium]|nr:DUF445 family protein [Bacillota bacterium]HPZ22056.1 DUF445 family protein [Bacillota bacterium]